MKTKNFIVIRLVLLLIVTSALVGQAAANSLEEGGSITDKTMVAWVKLANLTQRGCGIISLWDYSAPGNPDDECFDAIVFGERVEQRWMAGSNWWNRTQDETAQGTYPSETADSETLVGIAIVWEGDPVTGDATMTIYRDGVLYAGPYTQGEIWTYPIDGDIAILLGMRSSGHFGLGGAFNGVIEEARIYNQALDAQTIAELAPNKPSDPQPLGLWDFEDGTATDAMGVFPEGELHGNAYIAEGQLFLDGQDNSYVEIRSANSLEEVSSITDKTMVAWVKIADLTQRGNGIISIWDNSAPGKPDDECFDGIVYGERMEQKWMAGSEWWNRTQDETAQGTYPSETADSETLVGIAIVWEGDPVTGDATMTIYRDGVLYAGPYTQGEIWTYPIDGDIAILLGMRSSGHFGLGGAFNGVIEEARIYNQALDAQTIAELAPNKPSDPQPLGLWTFEDGTATDAMGVFPEGELHGNAYIADGQLFLDGQDSSYVEIRPANSLEEGGSITDKTMVAWVTLDTLEQRGGSVLTLQRGGMFDAIVYAERQPYRWMAGSENWSRTQGDQSGNAAEVTDLNELVQVAIVYSSEKIRIYRQGALYAWYAAQNISLMEGNDYIAVFGWRHIGAGSGIFAGSIEDARIYDQALSAEQISGLQPNEPSAFEPIAWWDFEGDEIVDRAGRFSHHAMTDGVTLTNGRLHLDGQGYLVAALSEADALRATREEDPLPPQEFPAWPEDPPANWLTFHLAHPGPGVGTPGDPNPAFDYKGRYHLHYIYGSNGYNFAHVSSDDMVRWQWHPTVLSHQALGHGMFSGTGFFTKDGTPAMIYHGEGSGRNWIRYALDDQLDSWSDAQAVIPLDEDGQEHPMEPGGHGDIRHWDPDLWLNNDTYYAYAGGENPQLMKSDDLENWTYIGDLFHPDYSPEDLGVSRNIDVSCGNMFKIGNKWMLLNIDHGSGCRYYLGDFKDEQYLPESHHRMSFGSDVYFAPETMLTRNGRRVMWAWLREPPVAPTGIQSLPRELELPEDGVLRIRPLQELASLRYDPISREAFTMAEGNEVFLEEITGDAIEMEVTFDWPLPEACGIDLLGSEYGTGSMRIIAGVGRNSVQVGTTEAPFTLKDGEDLTLRVFIDKNLVEVFINDRQAAVYVTPDIRENPNIHLFAEGGEATVKTLKAWKMKSIYIDDEESDDEELNTATDLTPIQNEINVYPNPFTKILTVSGKKDITNLKIYQIDGSLVYSKEFDPQRIIELSTENFESGIYILSIQTVDGYIGMNIIRK